VEKTYLCIDLKSFYASVEAVERGLDPFKTNLVVADETRGRGAICLAITPAMKALGIKNRCRVYEIPENVEYITAMPRMKKYMEYSAMIYGIYLKYISKDDIYVYSIDECFFDVTSYLWMYGTTPVEMAQMLMDAVYKETGICATAGVGTNMFLAKVALDITAKHAPDNIGYLDEEEFKKSVWRHRPITDIWNIGRGIANRLAKYGIYDLWGVTQINEETLYREFGVNAEFLIDHAHGREPCTIEEIKSFKPESASISNSQILFRDYTWEEALTVVKEMVDLQVLELVEKNLVTNSMSLSVAYSKNSAKATGGTAKLSDYTNSARKIMPEFIDYYERTVRKDKPIRKITVGFNHLVVMEYRTIDMFADVEADEKEKKKQEAIIAIKKKFGKNAILKGTSLEKNATAMERNKLIGGHRGE